MKQETKWWKENWRSVAFIVYFIICIFDFVVMPSIVEITNKSIDIDLVTTIALKFQDAAVQMELIKQLGSKRTWTPLTMDGAAAFHFAFGAILTGAAWTRGMENIEKVKRSVSKEKKSSITPDNPDAN